MIEIRAEGGGPGWTRHVLDVKRGAIPVALRYDKGLRQRLTEVLRGSFQSYFLEFAPIAPSTADHAAEFVLVDSPALARITPDSDAFRSVFARKPGEIVTSPNLSGDAVLVLPRPTGADWADLARFVRSAPAPLVDQLWTEVGAACVTWQDTREAPLWLSTSGLGVHWLHVRLDTAPKYYSHREYRVA